MKRISRVIIPVLLCAAGLIPAKGRSAEIIAFNKPVEFKPRAGGLTIGDNLYASPGKTPVLEDCAKKLRDFSKNSSSFFRIRIEYEDPAARKRERLLNRCTLDPR